MNAGKPWGATFQRIRALHWPECIYPPRTTAAELDTAEAELGFRFPASYRAFAQEFGLDGDLPLLAHVLPLHPPPGATDEDWFRSVTGNVRFYRTNDWEGWDWDPEMAPLDFLRRVVVFATDPGYHDWAFDPLEVTNQDSNEYRIYDIDRSTHATLVADSFDGWLNWIDEERRRDGGDDFDDADDTEFPPVYRPDSSVPGAMVYARNNAFERKVAPPSASVERWLVANDSAALGIARAIRAEGQSASFPILADALEDAGCDSRDLLHWCRNGDPDIDGAWVLQVLLGRASMRALSSREG